MKKISQIIERLRAIASFGVLLLKGKRTLFVLGHMRSGSTLLVHILTSNPEITGIGELHMAYHHIDDFALSVSKIKENTSNSEIEGKYILNKILHANYIPNIRVFSQLLKITRGKVIVIVRNPYKSIPSITNLQLEGIKNNDDANEYYSNQLKFINELTRVLPKNKVHTLTYESLLDDDCKELKKLTDFLQLNVPLSNNYEVKKTTGIKGIGDPSANIFAGKILKEAEKTIDYQSRKSEINRYQTANELYERFNKKEV